MSWDLSLNDAWAEFKANPVQRKSDLIFTQSSLNVIMPKSSWLAPHPLRCSSRRAFGSLKTLFNPSRRISHHLCCGSLPFAFAGSSSQWELNIFLQNISLLSLTLSVFTVLWLIPWFWSLQSLDTNCNPAAGVLKDVKSNILYFQQHPTGFSILKISIILWHFGAI